jgi:hypothetical protein
MQPARHLQQRLLERVLAGRRQIGDVGEGAAAGFGVAKALALRQQRAPAVRHGHLAAVDLQRRHA